MRRLGGSVGRWWLAVGLLLTSAAPAAGLATLPGDTAALLAFKAQIQDPSVRPRTALHICTGVPAAQALCSVV